MSKESSWVRVQELAFTQWMDETVKKFNMSVNDLRTDLQDGLKLIAFFEALSGHKMIDRYDKKPVQKIQKINNLSVALRFLERDMMVRNPGCAPEDIYDAEKKGIKLVLGLLYVLYRKYRMAAGLGSGGKTREEDMLLDWVREVLAKHGFTEEADSVQSFRSSFNDGRVFLALAKAYDGDDGELDFSAESEKNAAEKLEAAFSYAENKMGVSHLLEASDVASVMVDERALALYTSLFYHAFKTKSELEQMQLTVGKSAEELELQKKGKEELIRMNCELSEQIAAAQREIAQLKAQLEEQKEETNEEKKRNVRTHKEIEDKESEITEMHTQSHVNSSGLATLRASLDAHLSDLLEWQKSLDGNVSQVMEPTEEIDAIVHELDNASYQEQLSILSAAFQEESVEMAKILAERKRDLEEYEKANIGEKKRMMAEMRKKQFAALMSSEKEFFHGLQSARSTFINPIKLIAMDKSNPMISVSVARDLLSNFPDVRKLHKAIGRGLKEKDPWTPKSTVTDVFEGNMNRMIRLYREYSKRNAAQMATLNSCMERDDFRQWLTDLEASTKLSFSDLLKQPFNRIGEYYTVLLSMLHNTDPESEDYEKLSRIVSKLSALNEEVSPKNLREDKGSS